MDKAMIVAEIKDHISPTVFELMKVNLDRPNDASYVKTKMADEVAAPVYEYAFYVTGVGEHSNEIWKYGIVSGWSKCVHLVQARRKQCTEFVDVTLYICGGYVDSDWSTLNGVEGFNILTNECTKVGQLVYGVRDACCVAYKSSVYVFSGSDKHNKDLDLVQIYNTENNQCTLLSKPMPSPQRHMRAVLHESSVILMGCHTCFIVDLETGTWQEREQFKTGVSQFGLILDNGRMFVIDGAAQETNKDGNKTWKCRNEVRYVPVAYILSDIKTVDWKHHSRLPMPILIPSCVVMRFPRPDENVVTLF